MSDNFKTGVGAAMASKGDRRKRSSHPTFWPVNIVELFNSKVRAKRQAEYGPQTGSPQMPPGMAGNSDSMFDRIKATFNRILDVAKDMVSKMRQVAGSQGQGGQMNPQPNNAEIFQ